MENDTLSPKRASNKRSYEAFGCKYLKKKHQERLVYEKIVTFHCF